MPRQRWLRRLVVILEIVLLMLSISSLSPVSTAHATDCTVDAFSVTPNSSPQPVGTILALHGEGKCSGTIRASRFNIDGEGFGEDADQLASVQDETWAITAGDHTICFEIDSTSNSDWSDAARSCMNIRGEAPTAVCNVDSFSVSPSSGTVGTTFTLSGSGSCNIGVRAVRFVIDGVPFGEFGGSSHTTPWGSSGYGVGDHVIEFQVTAGEWSAAAVASTIVTLTDPNAPPTSTPPPSTTPPPPTVVPTPTPPGLPFWCSSTPPSGRWIRIVSPSGMLVRRLPTTLSNPIGRVNTGMYCELLYTAWGWHLIRSNGRFGFIAAGSQYTQVGSGNNSTSTPPPIPTVVPTPSPTPIPSPTPPPFLSPEWWHQGTICNRSSVVIWIVVINIGSLQYNNRPLDIGDCTTNLEDAEGIWGNRCDSSLANCPLRFLKVGGPRGRVTVWGRSSDFLAWGGYSGLTGGWLNSAPDEWRITPPDNVSYRLFG